MCCPAFAMIMRGRAALALVIASAAVIAVLAGVFIFPGSGPTVTVSSVNFVGNGACSILMIGPGFVAAPGTEEHFSGLVDNNEQRNCTIQSIRSETPGFTVVGANVPLEVHPGVEALSWVVQLPFYFDGNLTLNLTGTWSPVSTTPANNTTCPSPCISTHIPSGLYFYTFGEVLPAGWIVVEAGSVGTLIGAITWAATRRH
jgi:hypothetical protein